MFHRMNRPSLRFPLKIFNVLVLHLLLTHSCRGQSQLIGPSQPIVATVGDDIILPCQLNPAEDVAALTLEWTRLDLDSINVHVCRAGQDLTHVKHPSYKGRTSLFIDELKQGNISLKLSKVKLSDGGKYRCFIPQLSKQSFVELVVGAVSPPFISLAGIDRVRGGVVLQCESKGWYPQPEVFWMDSERNLLSAEPTETVRGPDGLYTVSSRVTVEKRHNNSFTCRVQQNKINQIRETHIIVPDDFLKVQSSSSPVIIGLAVTLVVCIVFIVAIFFFVWKWRQSMIKTKKTEGGGPEMQLLNPAGPDGQTLPSQLETDQTAPVQSSSSLIDAKAEKQNLQTDLTTKTTEIETLQESEKQLKAQNKEWEGKQADTDRLLQEEKQKREKAEREVKDLKNQLESNQKQIDAKEAEKQNLQTDLTTKTREIETLQESEKQLKAQNKELRENQTAPNKVFLEERKTLESKMKDLQNQLESNQKQIEAKEAEIQKLQGDLTTKTTEIKTFTDSNERNLTDLKAQHQKEIEAKQAEVQKLQTDLNTKTTEIKTLQKSEKQLKAQNEELKEKPEEDDQRKTDAEDVKNSEEEKKEVHHEDKSPPGGNSIPAPNSTSDENDGSNTSSQEDKSPAGENSNPEPISTPEENNGSNTSSQLEEKPEEDDERKTDEEEQENKERPEASQHNDTDPACKNSTEVFVEVDPDGKYIRLITKSKEDLKLEGWRLRVKVNNKKPIMFIFEESVKLRAEKRVTIWAFGCGLDRPPYNHIWMDLNRWAKGDKILVELINCRGEIVKTTEV